MYKIVLEADALPKRSNAIRALLQTLLIDPNAKKPSARTTIACQAVSIAQNYIIGTFDGSKTSSSYRDWRFSSYRNEFRCMYFEEWEPIDATKKRWLLRQTAFSLFRTIKQSREEQEVLAIHCEPLEPDGQKHIQYKRGLHLHVSLSSQPLPHAHFALTNGYNSTVMMDIESLSAALKLAFAMVKDQVIANADWK